MSRTERRNYLGEWGSESRPPATTRASYKPRKNATRRPRKRITLNIDPDRDAKFIQRR